MSMWPTDDPAGTHASELAAEDTVDDDHAPGCATLACRGECLRAAAKQEESPRARMRDSDEDYDGPTRPF